MLLMFIVQCIYCLSHHLRINFTNIWCKCSWNQFMSCLFKSFTHLMIEIDIESKNKNEILYRTSSNVFLYFLACILLNLIVTVESCLVRVSLIIYRLDLIKIAYSSGVTLLLINFDNAMPFSAISRCNICKACLSNYLE